MQWIEMSIIKMIDSKETFSKWEYQDQILIHTLTQGVDTSYSQLQEAELAFANKCLELKADLVLEDTRSFRMEVPDDYGDWVTNTVSPIYRQVPVKKIAAVTNDGVYHFFKGAELEHDGITKRVFDSREAALEWLKDHSTR